MKSRLEKGLEKLAEKTSGYGDAADSPVKRFLRKRVAPAIGSSGGALNRVSPALEKGFFPTLLREAVIKRSGPVTSAKRAKKKYLSAWTDKFLSQRMGGSTKSRKKWLEDETRRQVGKLLREKRGTKGEVVGRLEKRLLAETTASSL